MIDGYDFYYVNFFSLVFWRLLIKNRKKFFFVVCFQFFLVLALRSKVGCDSQAQYPEVYEGASSLSFSQLISGWSFIKQFRLPNGWGGESGYVTLNWIFGGLLGLPYQVFIAFLALIAAFAVYKYLVRNSYSPLLGAMAMYVYLLHVNAYFSAIRRTTALSFIFFAYMAMEEKKYKKAALILLLAMTMHRSAILIFLILPFAHIKITRELFLKTLFMIFACALLAVPIVMRFLPVLLSAFGKIHYLSKLLTSRGFSINVEVKAIAGIIAVIAIYFCLDFRLLQTSYNSMMCKILIFIMLLQPIQSLAPAMLAEVYSYFIPSCYLLVENLIVQRREDLFIKRIMWLIALLVLFNALYRSVEGSRNSAFFYYDSYKTIWTAEQ